MQSECSVDSWLRDGRSYAESLCMNGFDVDLTRALTALLEIADMNTETIRSIENHVREQEKRIADLEAELRRQREENRALRGDLCRLVLERDYAVSA